jgi:hypothetical protein
MVAHAIADGTALRSVSQLTPVPVLNLRENKRAFSLNAEQLEVF